MALSVKVAHIPTSCWQSNDLYFIQGRRTQSSHGPGLWLNQGGKVREPFSEVQINTKERSLSISQGNKCPTVLGEYGDFLELKYKIQIFPKFLKWATKQSLGRFQWLLSTAVSRPSQQPVPSARAKGTEPAGDSEAGYLLPEVSRKQSVWTQEQRSIQNDKGRWGVDYDHNQVLWPGASGTLDYISNRRKVLHSLEFTAITPQREKAVLVTEARMAMCDWLHLINGWPPSNYKTWCWQVLIGWYETW